MFIVSLTIIGSVFLVMVYILDKRTGGRLSIPERVLSKQGRDANEKANAEWEANQLKKSQSDQDAPAIAQS